MFFVHANTDYIMKTSQLNTINDLCPLKKLMNFSCEQCKINKFKSISFYSNDEAHSFESLNLLYIDTWDPINILGENGERYYY